MDDLIKAVEELLCALDDLPLTIEILIPEVSERIKDVEAILARKGETNLERTTFTMD